MAKLTVQERVSSDSPHQRTPYAPARRSDELTQPPNQSSNSPVTGANMWWCGVSNRHQHNQVAAKSTRDTRAQAPTKRAQCLAKFNEGFDVKTTAKALNLKYQLVYNYWRQANPNY